jgi:hypothetical protein
MDWGAIVGGVLYTAFDFTEVDAWFVWGPILLAGIVKGLTDPVP